MNNLLIALIAFVTFASTSSLGAQPAGSTCIINSDCQSGLCMQPPGHCSTELCPTAQCLGNSPNVNIRTPKGTFLTAVNGGGIGGADAAINTDRTQKSTWETFTCQLMLPNLLSLKTSDGHWVTATNGGGTGGPNADPWEIHTDATVAQGWEQFQIITNNANQCALKTSTGNFVTAVNGGSYGNNDQSNHFPIHTNAIYPQPGPWETFTLIPK